MPATCATSFIISMMLLPAPPSPENSPDLLERDAIEDRPFAFRPRLMVPGGHVEPFQLCLRWGVAGMIVHDFINTKIFFDDLFFARLFRIREPAGPRERAGEPLILVVICDRGIAFDGLARDLLDPFIGLRGAHGATPTRSRVAECAVMAWPRRECLGQTLASSRSIAPIGTSNLRPMRIVGRLTRLGGCVGARAAQAQDFSRIFDTQSFSFKLLIFRSILAAHVTPRDNPYFCV